MDAIPHLLVSFVDVFGDGWEVRVELAEGFHNRRSVWCVLEYPHSLPSKGIFTKRRESYKFPRDAVVEFFDCPLVGVGGECAVGCPIRGGVKELDCICHPRLSRCHPYMGDAKGKGWKS